MTLWSSPLFRSESRAYNNIFAFASLIADVKIPPGCGAPVFRIQGAVRHGISSLQPQQGDSPKFGQIYIYDAQEASRRRHSIFDGLDLESVEMIERNLRQVNPYAAAYKTAAQKMSENPTANVQIILRSDPSLDMRVYNAPTVSTEFATIIKSDQSRSTLHL